MPVEGAKLTAEAVVAWARENMAAHKYPRLVEIRDALPLTRDRQDPQTRTALGARLGRVEMVSGPIGGGG